MQPLSHVLILDSHILRLDPYILILASNNI